MSGDGMADMVSALLNPSTGNGLTSAGLWAELVPLAALITGVAIFAFGFGRFRKATKGASKGKFNI